MKNKLLALSFIGIFALCSCQKLEENTLTKNPNKTMARYKGTGKYWDGVDKCPAGDGNCLDEVVVRAPRKADLIVAIGNGTLPTYLTDHPEVYQDLTASGSSLTTSYIDGLKSGQYNAVFKTDLPLGFPSDNKVILIGEGLVTNTDYEVLFVLK